MNKRKSVIKIKGIIVILSWLLGFMANAQEHYFSQFYASPLNLNPALSGVSSGDLRVAMNYRDQSNNLLSYTTFSGSFDMKILRGQLDNDVAAIGLVAVSDQMANNAISSLYMLGSGAYHFALGPSNSHYLALGFQGGIFQRKIDMNEFSFPNQWTISTFYDETIPHGLNITNNQSLTADLNAGLFWYHFIENNSTVFGGIAVYHVFEPSHKFLSNDAHINRKMVLHGGRRIPVSRKIRIIPNVLYMQQNKANQIAGGADMEYHFPDSEFALKTGLWYRFYNHSVISSLGVIFKNIKFGLSYDIYSKVQAMSRTNGGLEFSLVYSPVLKDIIRLENNPGKSF